MKRGSDTEEDARSFSRQEMERRHMRIREGMQLRGLACLVAVDNDIIRYIAGAAKHATPHKPGDVTGVLIFPLLGEPVLLVATSFHAQQLQKESWVPVTAVGFRKGQPEGVRIREYGLDTAERLKSAGIEGGSVGLATWRGVPAYMLEDLRREVPRASFVSAGDLIMECRRIKSSEELRLVRKAAEGADAGIQAIVEAARPGVTEAELVAACDYAMVRAGCERGSMLLLGTGPFDKMEGAIMDTSQSRKKVRKGDIILNELSPIYCGYNAQLCVPICVGGAPPASFLERMKIDNALYDLAFGLLRPGNRQGDIDRKVKELADKLAPGRFKRAWTLQAHELDHGQDRLTFETMKPGMVWVSHPWTTPTGKGYEGHTIGNTLIVTEGKPESTSRWARDVVIV